MPSCNALHIWFTDGWQFHYFVKHSSAVVISPGPGSQSLQPLHPRATPYFAAVCQHAKLTSACQERLGLAPWEMAEAAPGQVDHPPAIAKLRWED